MNNPQNLNKSKDKKNARRAAERRMLPFAIEFVKFSASFAVIIAVALIVLHTAQAAGQ